jgi:hypothetical protein
MGDVMKFLTYTELKEMNGAKVLFNLGREMVAAKVFIHNNNIFLAQNRHNGSDYGYNKSGMRFLWYVDEPSCPELFITNDVDTEVMDKFIEIDKQYVNLYNDSEHKIAELTKTCMELSIDISKEVLSIKEEQAKELVKKVQEDAANSITESGIETTYQENKSKSDARVDNALGSWNK